MRRYPQFICWITIGPSFDRLVRIVVNRAVNITVFFIYLIKCKCCCRMKIENKNVSWFFLLCV